jgi:hypothetical protein
MPTLISEDPDCYDLDYYYKNYNDRYGLVTNESRPSQLRVLGVGQKPDSCDLVKMRHFFTVPLQPSIGVCFCGKYHTSFTSKTYRIQHATTLGEPLLTTTTTAITEMKSKDFRKLDSLPQSPLPERPTENLLTQANPRILFPVFQTDPTPTPIIPHSHHYHGCVLCKSKNILCAISAQNVHTPDYTVSVVFKTQLIHRECIPLLNNVKMEPLYKTTPLNINQKLLICFIKLAQMPAKDKVKLFIKLFPKKASQTPNLHQHNCTICKVPIDCRINANNLHTLASNAMAVENKPYHLTCIPISQLSASETQSGPSGNNQNAQNTQPENNQNTQNTQQSSDNKLNTTAPLLKPPSNTNQNTTNTEDKMDIDNNTTENKSNKAQQQEQKQQQQKTYSNILNTNLQ